MSDFKPFSQAVHKQFESMSKHELFVVDVSGDDLLSAEVEISKMFLDEMGA